jgi:hypothetical protein
MVVGYALLSWLSQGCAAIDDHGQPSAGPPLKVAVGPVFFEAPIPKSSQIYSFSDDPTPEMEPIIAAQLIDEIQVKAQMFLTTHLSQQSGVVVVNFDEVRRIMGDVAPGGVALSVEQADTLAARTGADVVVTGLIHDYGRVRWQYWTTGWLMHVAVATTVVGFATAWNPAAIGIYLAVDATTDFPLWYGGASIFGWAFQPVRVHADMVQVRNCRGVIWSQDELVVRVPGKTLADYPPAQRSRKETQLEANLNRVMGAMAESIGDSLALQPCNSSGMPKKISSFTLWSVFDLLY